MQYLMKPAISLDMYEVALFDTVKDNVDLNSVKDLTTLSSVLQEARAFMGTNSFLNPVRGKSADGNYYLTFLRFAFYGYSNSTDRRPIGQMFAAIPTQSGYFKSIWTSVQKADGSVQTEYRWRTSYNVNAPIPKMFNGSNINTLLVLPKMKIRNSFNSSFDINFVETYAQGIYPGVDNTSYRSNAAAVPFNLAANTTSDWIYPQITTSLNYIQYVNLIASNTINTPNYMYINQDDSYGTDGLSCLKDVAPSTKIADLPADEIVLDAGLIWLDSTRMLKLSQDDWSSRSTLLPGTRPKFVLDRLIKNINV